MYAEPMVTIELKEYQDLKDRISQLLNPGDGSELTKAEQNQVVGRLLYVALNNPSLFRIQEEIDLGKFTAVITQGVDIHDRNRTGLQVVFKRN